MTDQYLKHKRGPDGCPACKRMAELQDAIISLMVNSNLHPADDTRCLLTVVAAGLAGLEPALMERGIEIAHDYLRDKARELHETGENTDGHRGDGTIH
jgi:hypothetical protein